MPESPCLPLPRKLCAVCVVPSSFTCVTCGDRYCSLKYLERSYVLASCGGLTNYKIFFNGSLFSNEHTIWDRHANEGGHPAEDQHPAAEEFTEEILLVPIMCSYLASRCCCDMSMWCIFDCISLWALALPSSSFIPSTLNDFRKSYFVITIINHIHLFIIMWQVASIFIYSSFRVQNSSECAKGEEGGLYFLQNKKGCFCLEWVN